MDINEIITFYTNSAIEIAHRTYGKTLDFSEESIDIVAEILDGYHERYLDPEKDGGAVRERVDVFAAMFGIYTGEVLSRMCGDYVWAQTEYGMMLKCGKNALNPISKARKHIVNGREEGDDIKPFFNVALQIMEGKLPQ